VHFGFFEFPCHETLDFRDDKQVDCLPTTDSSHTESACMVACELNSGFRKMKKSTLRVVTECHVFSESQNGASIQHMLDIHTGRVNLLGIG